MWEKPMKALLFILSCAVLFAGIYFFKGIGQGQELEIEWILPPKYHSVNYNEGRIWAQEKGNGPWTLFDEKANIIKEGVDAIKIAPFDNGFAHFQKDADHDGFFDLSGDVFSIFNRSADSEEFNFSYEGLLKTRGDNGLYGFTDIYGTWVISPDYQDAMHFSEGLCAVKKDNKYGYIDRSGRIAIDFKFIPLVSDWDVPREASNLNFSHGMAVVKVDSLYGVIDKTGNWIADPVYESFGFPWEDLIGLQKNGEFGFIDYNGNIIINFQFRSLIPSIDKFTNLFRFNEGMAVILDEGKQLIINKSGDVLSHIPNGEYPALGIFMDGFLLVKESKDNGTKSFLDKDGKRYLLPAGLKSNEFGLWGLGKGVYMAITAEDGTMDFKTGYFKIIDIKEKN